MHFHSVSILNKCKQGGRAVWVGCPIVLEYGACYKSCNGARGALGMLRESTVCLPNVDCHLVPRSRDVFACCCFCAWGSEKDRLIWVGSTMELGFWMFAKTWSPLASFPDLQTPLVVQVSQWRLEARYVHPNMYTRMYAHLQAYFHFSSCKGDTPIAGACPYLACCMIGGKMAPRLWLEAFSRRKV